MAEQAARKRPTVLMVEDDDDMVNLVRFLLEREGYGVVHAADGLQAQQCVDGLPPPQMVLLDVMLPHLSGLDLITQIRDKPAWRKVPIIMLTCDATERDIVRALDAGASDYIVKPFNPKELVARLRRFIKPAPAGGDSREQA